MASSAARDCSALARAWASAAATWAESCTAPPRARSRAETETSSGSDSRRAASRRATSRWAASASAWALAAASDAAAASRLRRLASTVAPAATAWAFAEASRASDSASAAPWSAQSSSTSTSPAFTGRPFTATSFRTRAVIRAETSTLVPSISPEPPGGALRARAWTQMRTPRSATSATTTTVTTTAMRRIRRLLARADGGPAGRVARSVPARTPGQGRKTGTGRAGNDLAVRTSDAPFGHAYSPAGAPPRQPARRRTGVAGGAPERDGIFLAAARGMIALAALLALLAAAPSGEVPPVSMSLPEALAELDRQNPSIEEARGRAAAALGVVRQAAAPLLPNLSAGGGYFHNNTSVIITAPSGGALERIYLQPLDAWYGSAGLRVPLIVPEAWFSVAAARDSALAAAEASGRHPARRPERPGAGRLDRLGRRRDRGRLGAGGRLRAFPGRERGPDPERGHGDAARGAAGRDHRHPAGERPRRRPLRAVARPPRGRRAARAPGPGHHLHAARARRRLLRPHGPLPGGPRRPPRAARLGRRGALLREAAEPPRSGGSRPPSRPRAGSRPRRCPSPPATSSAGASRST